MYTHTYVRTCIYIHTCTRIHIYTHTYTYMYSTYTYMCTHTHEYTHNLIDIVVIIMIALPFQDIITIIQGVHTYIHVHVCHKVYLESEVRSELFIVLKKGNLPTF